MSEQGSKDILGNFSQDTPANHVDESPPIDAAEYRATIKKIAEEIQDTSKLKRIYLLASYLYTK